MKVLRRLMYRDIFSAVAFVTLAFLALFFFFDLLEELRWVNRIGNTNYKLIHALVSVSLSMPQHLYELLPITVLIGTIFVMARLAQTSEFTIMRTSGLGPWRALGTLLSIGVAFVVLTFAVGDYAAPAAEKIAQKLRAEQLGQLPTGASGAWLKERQGDHSIAINIRTIKSPGEFSNVRIFDFDADGRISAQINAESAHVDDDKDIWVLRGVKSSHLQQDGERTLLKRQNSEEMAWPTSVSAAMVAAALIDPDKMQTLALFQYVRHLESNGQSAQKYEIEFWRKVFYPLSCLVMVVLALPFAYLHFRSGGIAGYVFGGVMAGISFFLLNNVFGYMGTLQSWSPWLSAAAPGLIYSILSLGAFSWLVLRR